MNLEKKKTYPVPRGQNEIAFSFKIFFKKTFEIFVDFF